MEQCNYTFVLIVSANSNQKTPAWWQMSGQSSDYMYFAHWQVTWNLSSIADLIDHVSQYLLILVCLFLSVLTKIIKY